MQKFRYTSIKNLLEIAEREALPFYKVVEQAEVERTGVGTAKIRQLLAARIEIFRQSVRDGINDLHKTPSGMSGKVAYDLLQVQQKLLGPLPYRALLNAIAVSEANAKMYRVVACPTAGSCGILPGCFVAMEELLQIDEENLINGLLVAAGIGNVITNNATVAGAEGGCQAECGAASAMAAAGITSIMGGTNEQIVEAASLALKNVLGLVCDPVAGLVEVPCVKRNGMHAVHSITAAEMALAGVSSIIPLDEIIAAMFEIGKMMPTSLRETSEGGLAKTPTGIRIAKEVAEL